MHIACYIVIKKNTAPRACSGIFHSKDTAINNDVLICTKAIEKYAIIEWLVFCISLLFALGNV